MTPKIRFLLGGSRSGKSRQGEELAQKSGWPVTFVATWLTGAEDQEMDLRVKKHRDRRPAEWRTVENRTDLHRVIEENAGRCVLLDCLTLWLGAGMEAAKTEEQILSEWDRALILAKQHLPLFLVVSNEVGLSLVPGSPEGRAFRDLAGRANQATAAQADRVDFMVAGIPWTLKGEQA